MANRREFVQRAGGLMGSAWLTLNLPGCGEAADYAREAAADGRGFNVLTAHEGRVLEAMTGVIIPTDDLPGAREAGAVHFIDRFLETVDDSGLPIYREGVANLEERVAADARPHHA